MEYFIVMIDFGRAGREAIVNPEMTRRRGAVEYVREKIGDGKTISFIHRIRDCTVEDVTNELLKEAGFYEQELPEVDHRSIRFDRNHDHRKNYEVV
jgi:hypothetical protein